jgi:hypothetical protein
MIKIVFLPYVGKHLWRNSNIQFFELLGGVFGVLKQFKAGW